jgi:hypothetical protein
LHGADGFYGSGVLALVVKKSAWWSLLAWFVLAVYILGKSFQAEGLVALGGFACQVSCCSCVPFALTASLTMQSEITGAKNEKGWNGWIKFSIKSRTAEVNCPITSFIND